VGNGPSRWFIALVLGLGAGALPVAGSADTGPVPVDPPACVSMLPELTASCPQPSPSQPQAAGVSSAQRNSSQSRAFAVSGTPDLARTLVVAVNRARRAHGLRPLRTPVRWPMPRPGMPRLLRRRGRSRTTGRRRDGSSRAGSAASIRRAATGCGGPAKTCSGHRLDSLLRTRYSSGSTALRIAESS
jgi:hypothetical protein